MLLHQLITFAASTVGQPVVNKPVSTLIVLIQAQPFIHRICQYNADTILVLFEYVTELFIWYPLLIIQTKFHSQ